MAAAQWALTGLVGEVPGKKDALPWPAPSSFSAHEMQLDFSKLLGEEP